MTTEINRELVSVSLVSPVKIRKFGIKILLTNN